MAGELKRGLETLARLGESRLSEIEDLHAQLAAAEARAERAEARHAVTERDACMWAERAEKAERELEAERADRLLDRYGMQDGSLLRDLRARIAELEQKLTIRKDPCLSGCRTQLARENREDRN